MSTSATRLPPSIEQLTKRRDQLLAELALLESSRPTRLAPLPAPTTQLLSQLGSHPSNPTTNSRLIAGLPGASRTRASELDEATERARRYRLTGRSVFGVELARGKRAKESERQRVQGGKGKGREEEGKGEEFVRKGVAVRLETFWKGRFFEPFYLVFDRVRTTDTADPLPGDARLQLVHHTIPPFVPLRSLCIEYLGVPIRGQSDLYSEAGEEVELEARSVAREPDLDLFLTRLQMYLDAFIARRQQLEALRLKYAKPAFNQLRLAIFSSASADRVLIEWDLPDTRDEEDGEESLRASRSVALQLAWDDLRSSIVGESEESDRQSATRGAALLVRHVLTDPASGDPPQSEIISRGERTTSDLTELIEHWITRTTDESWTLENSSI